MQYPSHRVGATMYYQDFPEARSRVAGPATALLFLAGISAGLLVLALAVDAYLLLSGTAARMAAQTGRPHEEQVVFRAGWGAVMLVVNAVILAGAVQMRALRNRGLAITACVLALIPCLGPCFFLGVPFGIWGLITLGDPYVRRGFGASP